MTDKTKKKILHEYYEEGLPLLKILDKHRNLTYGELRQIILEDQEHEIVFTG
jgi:hypothetical protein